MSGEARSGSRERPAAAAPAKTRKAYGSTDNSCGTGPRCWSLPIKAEAPVAPRGIIAEMFWRVVAGAVVLALFAAAVSSLYDGPVASGASVGGTKAGSPTMVTEVGAERLRQVPCLYVAVFYPHIAYAPVDRRLSASR